MYFESSQDLWLYSESQVPPTLIFHWSDAIKKITEIKNFSSNWLEKKFLRETMRLKLSEDQFVELAMIHERCVFLSDKYEDGNLMKNIQKEGKIRINHGEELESYKIKLENLYEHTDMKEKLLTGWQLSYSCFHEIDKA